MIGPEDLVEDLVSAHPATVRVFMDHSFPCLVCGEPVWGTIAENARRNGLSDQQLEALLDDLNRIISST